MSGLIRFTVRPGPPNHTQFWIIPRDFKYFPLRNYPINPKFFNLFPSSRFFNILKTKRSQRVEEEEEHRETRRLEFWGKPYRSFLKMSAMKGPLERLHLSESHHQSPFPDSDPARFQTLLDSAASDPTLPYSSSLGADVDPSSDDKDGGILSQDFFW